VRTVDVCEENAADFPLLGRLGEPGVVFQTIFASRAIIGISAMGKSLSTNPVVIANLTASPKENQKGTKAS
jgi:hypothetical protein